MSTPSSTTPSLSPAPIPAITGPLTVVVPVEQAFGVFTGSIDSWWPHETSGEQLEDRATSRVTSQPQPRISVS